MTLVLLLVGASLKPHTHTRSYDDLMDACDDLVFDPDSGSSGTAAAAASGGGGGAGGGAGAKK